MEDFFFIIILFYFFGAGTAQVVTALKLLCAVGRSLYTFMVCG